MTLPKTLQDKIDRIPTEPGVYLMIDRFGEVIYVGKAINLRSRVRSYFARSSGDSRAFVPLLDSLLGDIEILRVANEQEALLLENELIKRHRPRFNVLLRDDKDFLTLRLDTSHPYPRLEVCRRPKDNGARYFGPYTSAPALRVTLSVINRHFQLRTCTDSVMRSRKRPCLQHQINRCPAPCTQDVPEYSRNVADAVLFLEGRHGVLIQDLRLRMQSASERLAFEEAARVRDRIVALERVLEKQRVVQVEDNLERNAVGVYREGPVLVVQILEIQSGRLVGGKSYTFEQQEFPTSELLGSLLTQLYGSTAWTIPSEILLPMDFEGRAALQSWLTQNVGKSVIVHIPKRGEKRRLVEMANENALSAFVMQREQDADTRALLERLMNALSLSNFPRSIECYDISQTQGGEPVASRVAMFEALPDKAKYRRYRIKDVHGQDDFAMMREVLLRRIQRGKKEDDLPDLFVVDGGKGQLGVASAVLADCGVSDVDLIALAKSRRPKTNADSRGREIEADPTPERVFVRGRKDPIILPQDSAELLLLARLRDEAHRFAIEYHRKLRSRRVIGDALKGIAGVGDARSKALLRHFGSMKRLRNASVEEITEVEGFSNLLARKVKDAIGE